MNLQTLKFETPYLTLDKEFYEYTKPIELDNPYLIHFNSLASQLLGNDDVINNESDIISFMNGESTAKNFTTFSMCYAGFQFGNYIPILGDGRVHNYGKINGWNIQTKGSGETPFAKTADGRCTLASSIREYLMSEAMYHLGIPTTRVLAIIGSNTNIIRSNIEKAATVMRLSPSWIRFGSFEYFYYMKEYDKLKELADYVIEESFIELKNDSDKYYKMFCKIIDKTAFLLAKWQSIGFCHGVLNTDNISIEGLTLDYGPFSMMDEFNYNFICNKSDKAGRYAYGEQVNIMYWNLTKLMKSLTSLIDNKKMEKKLEEFSSFLYFDKYIEQMRKKLGLFQKFEEDRELIENLITTLHASHIDYTQFFRLLSHYNGEKMPLYEVAMEPVILDEWLKIYDKRLQKEQVSQTKRKQSMLKVNPKYILKNYMLDMAIQKAKQKDFSMIDTLMYIARNPYDELPEYESFTGDIPEEYFGLNLTCSS
jgi:serine/tyrosine/threonine adenylyltransferase